MKVYVGDITKVENVDAIVNAANAFGIMGAGVAGAIARSAGTSNELNGTNIYDIVEKVVEEQGPFQTGDVYVSDSGLLKRRGIKFIYHAVTMQFPGSLCSIGMIPKLLTRVFDTAIENNLKSIAICGLGCGIGGLGEEEVAIAMAGVAESYSHQLKIHVVDKSPRFINAFIKKLNIPIEQ
jgi:hypothetical protein